MTTHTSGTTSAERLVALLEEWLDACSQRGASDLHLSGGTPPMLRVRQDLVRMDVPNLCAADVESLARTIMGADHWRKFSTDRSVDFSYSAGNGERFRVNAFRQRGETALALRRLRNDALDFGHWNLPRELTRIAESRDGLYLVTGPTGSGKTTTLATIVHHLNSVRPCHVITIEDPIEFVHTSRAALIHQRELRSDVATFGDAVRESLREDPDVILVGEMRALDTIRAALLAAETGHLVLSTLHTGDAVGALQRLIGAFPAEERTGVQHQLAFALRGVVAQKLLPAADRGGLVPVLEQLWVNVATSNLIRTGRLEQIHSAMETGFVEGMRTFDRELAAAVGTGCVDDSVARRHVRNEEQYEAWIELSRRGSRSGAER